jgi:hypothetical protein
VRKEIEEKLDQLVLKATKANRVFKDQLGRKVIPENLVRRALKEKRVIQENRDHKDPKVNKVFKVKKEILLPMKILLNSN